MGSRGALPFWLVQAGPLLMAVALVAGGPWALAPALFVFGLLPLLDEAVGDVPDMPAPGPRWAFDLPLVLFAPVQLALIGWTIHAVAVEGRPRGEGLALLFSMGVVSGSGGITIAHELIHRASRLHRALGEVLMLSVGYPHFCVEHVYGHHRNVATPEDPATSRLGEGLYRFWWRSIAGGLVSAWRIERERVARSGARGVADRRLRHALLLAGLVTAIGAWGGASGVAAFAAQGLVAVLLLETVNYLEHYGLRRREVNPGEFERVQPHHSWNSNRAVSNAYLLNLARHADHHFLASRPYDALRPHPQAPALPYGYAAMLLLALLPPLWFRVMDPRVAAQNRSGQEQGEA
ncbi:MAG: alkane 1-monooxygenase [Vicinamibacteria bacterium]|nr:alkane 1-monooxygenase [Vicinamibacteria bacterium]